MQQNLSYTKLSSVSILRLKIIYFFWLTFYAATAQMPAYIQYTVRDGLPGNLVYCCAQDRRGLLWFGTDKGLTRFDGVRFHNYTMADGLPDPEVLGIKEDSSGRLWLFCFQKKPCYILDNQIITAKEDSSLNKINFNTGISKIFEDRDQGLWYIGMAKTCYYSYNNKINVYNLPYNVYNIGRIGHTLFAFGGNYIMSIEPSRKASSIYSIHIPPDATHINVGVSNEHILYSHGEKAFLLKYNKGRIRELMRINQPSGEVFVDRSGRFWICSKTSGAVCFDNKNQTLQNPIYFFKNKKITGMLEDTQGTLWFSTIDEGIIALPKNSPIVYGHGYFPSSNIRTISIDSNSRLFIGDNMGNINIISNSKIRTIALHSKKTYNQIRQISTIAAKGFWAATDKGLYHFTNSSLYPEIKIKFIALKSIVEEDDKIWYTSASRMGYLHVPSMNDIHIIDNHRFTSLSTDYENNIWAGSISGLYSQIDSFQKNWGDTYSELNSKIIAIKNGYNGRLWVATPNNGLLMLMVAKGCVNSVKVMNEYLETPIHNIQSLFVEQNHTVWMATNHGVYALDTSNYIRHFDTHDGLADDDVNAVLVNKDTLWVGTVSGLTRLILRPNDENGDFSTYITALKYQKNNIDQTIWLIDSVLNHSNVSLPKDATNIELNFTGLDFRSRGNLRFEIIQQQELLPFRWWTSSNLISWFDNYWSGHQDTVLISSPIRSLGTYFPAGKYRMSATALKVSGLRSNYPDTWIFIKLPYWYETIWFHLFLWLLAGYGGWRIYRARIAYQTALTAANELQLKALQSQINPHFIGNAINAIQQFLHPPDPIKASDYISVFMRLLRRTMQFSENTFIPFQEEISYDREYLQLAQLRFENQFSYEIIGEDILPPDTLIPAMILQPILENATIHGVKMDGASFLRLQFSFNRSILSCKVLDNGLGYSETMKQKSLNGVRRESKGLILLQNKIKSLNTIYNLDLHISIQDLSEIDSSQQGTQVTLTYSPELIWKTLKK